MKALNKINWQIKKATNAFTLVELIIVIIILAILGTIAFLSFNNYSSSARDSKRMSNIYLMANGFEVSISTWKPINNTETSALPNLVLSWSSILYKWYYDEPIKEKLLKSLWVWWWDIEKTSEDSFQAYRYAYIPSVQKYQIVWFLESQIKLNSYENFINSKVNADEWKWYAFLKWNYISTWWIVWLIPDPQVWENTEEEKITINWEDTEYSKKTIIGTDTIIPNWEYTINANIWINSVCDLSWITIYEWVNINAYSEYSIDSSASYNCTDRMIVRTCNNWVLSWDNSYQYNSCVTGTPDSAPAWNYFSIWTQVYNLPMSLAHWLSYTWNISISIQGWTKNYTATLICNDWIINVYNEVLDTVCDNWYILDNNSCVQNNSTYLWCDTPDITLSNWQTWAACNVWATKSYKWANPSVACSDGWGCSNYPYSISWKSILWWYYQWGRNIDVIWLAKTSWPVAVLNDNYFYYNNSTPYNYSSTNNYDSWWSSLSDNAGQDGQPHDYNRQWPCAIWRHVPSMKDWCNAIKNINPSLTCDYNVWQDDNSVASKLKLPLTWRRQGTDGVYNWQGWFWYYWTSSSISTPAAYIMAIRPNRITPFTKFVFTDATSVRCIKDDIVVSCNPWYHSEDDATCLQDTRSCIIENWIWTQSRSWNSRWSCQVASCNTWFIENNNACVIMWSLAWWWDCSYVDNSIWNDWNSSTCKDSRIYSMQWWATHDGIYSLRKIQWKWRFNENLAYPPVTWYRSNGSWSATDKWLYSCSWRNTTTSNIVDCNWIKNWSGYLYQWSAAMSWWISTNNQSLRVQGICPNWWAIPTYSDFTSTSNSFWPTSDNVRWWNISWIDKALNWTRAATNIGNFSGGSTSLPLWSSYSIASTNNARILLLYYTKPTTVMKNSDYPKANACSVRCIKN